jgi:hypothetical protein
MHRSTLSPLLSKARQQKPIYATEFASPRPDRAVLRSARCGDTKGLYRPFTISALGILSLAALFITATIAISQRSFGDFFLRRHKQWHPIRIHRSFVAPLKHDDPLPSDRERMDIVKCAYAASCNIDSGSPESPMNTSMCSKWPMSFVVGGGLNGGDAVELPMPLWTQLRSEAVHLFRFQYNCRGTLFPVFESSAQVRCRGSSGGQEHPIQRMFLGNTYVL